MFKAKQLGIFLRNQNDSDRWNNIIATTTIPEYDTESSEQLNQQMTTYFKAMTTTDAKDCLLSKNSALWAKAAQHFWFDKCGEDFKEVKNELGVMPQLVRKKVVKPKVGDIRDLVLPGGGDLSTRIWASIRAKVFSIRKWKAKGAIETPAFRDAIQALECFGYAEGQHNEHAWKTANDQQTLMIKCEISFLTDAAKTNTPYDTTNLEHLLDKIAKLALENGKAKAKQAYEDWVATALKDGAGPAHKMVSIDSALPPLRLVMKQ